MGARGVGGERVGDHDNVVADRAGRVRSRTTADKAVMTVTLANGTEERPVPAARRTAAVLDDAAAVELAALGTRIEAHFGAPQDIEWARAGSAFWIVQSRPITALPEPEAEPPTDWTVPDPTAMYVRASIVEQPPDLDFANAVPADDPAPVLDTPRFYLRNGGTDPHVRQRRSAERREAATTAVLARLDPLRRNVFTRLMRWAQGVAPVREDALGDIGLAWPQLRRMLHELGSRLASAHVIERPDDVFWLRRKEILNRTAGDIEQRRMVWRGHRRVTPPQVLPDRAAWRMMENFLPATTQDQTGSVLEVRRR